MTVNGPMEGRKTEINLNIGTYDAVVSTGPSYETQREEAADSQIQFYGMLPPQQQAVTSDLIPKNLDWPGADAWEDRLKSTLPPGLAEPEGPPPPPPPPDPIQELTMEKLKAEVGKQLLEHQKVQAEIEGILMDNRKKRDEVAVLEMTPDDLNARKTEAEIRKLNSDAMKQRER